jgi:hypothetical protein
MDESDFLILTKNLSTQMNLKALSLQLLGKTEETSFGLSQFRYQMRQRKRGGKDKIVQIVVLQPNVK